jgi:predicted DNA-binding transcriptional regulator YafY
MKFYSVAKKLECIHSLILNQNTGTPEELADKAGISRSSLYEYLSELKSFGADIQYSRRIRTFYYTSPFHFKLYINNGN